MIRTSARTISLLCAVGGCAFASGLDAPAVGSPFAGPAVTDPAALYWNPALLARLEEPVLSLGLGVVLGRVSYQRERRDDYQHADNFDISEPVEAGDIDTAKTGRSEEVEAPISLPEGDLFFALPVADRIALGFGIYSPYAAPIEWPDDGAQRFSLQRAFIAFTHVSLGLGVQLTEALFVGGSVSYVRGLASLSRVTDFASLDKFGEALAGPPTEQPNDFGADAPSTVRELDVLGRPFTFTDGTYDGVTFNLGVAVVPIPKLTLGLTYDHGYEAVFEGDFALNMNDPFFTQDLSAIGMEYVPLVEGRGTLAFELPKRVMFGAAYQAKSWLELLLRLEWVQWSSLDALRTKLTSPDLAQPELNLPDTSEVDLDRDWQDAIHVEVGARYALTDTLDVAMAFGYQSPASPDETIDAASPDGHRIIGVAGVGWAMSRGSTLKVDAELQGILPRTVTTSAHDLGNGTYNLLLAAISAHVEVRFGGSDAR